MGVTFLIGCWLTVLRFAPLLAFLQLALVLLVLCVVWLERLSAVGFVKARLERLSAATFVMALYCCFPAMMLATWVLFRGRSPNTSAVFVLVNGVAVLVSMGACRYFFRRHRRRLAMAGTYFLVLLIVISLLPIWFRHGVLNRRIVVYHWHDYWTMHVH